ncbi:uncharacterized protein LOC135382942 [Ornithodoros turicata]|uniref:uncharacterized protein LOC135382942 n=1 Tax=Ornithodoros turicata TaxID=34597 RepID=UPI0031397847
MNRDQKARGIVRAAVTGLIHRLEALSSSDEPSLPEVEDTARLLEQKSRELKDLDTTVQAGISDEQFEEDFTAASRYQDDICLAVSKAQRLIRSSAVAPTALSDQRPQTAPSIAAGSHQSATVRSVVLPKLHVPAFSGKVDDWQGFWDHYRTTIHECASLPKIEKFKYLLSYLSGPARRAIEWIGISDSNYDTAISTLQQRFGRQAALVDAHIDKLLSLHPVAAAKDVEKLRDLYDSIKFRTGCLNNLGVPQSTYAVILHRVVMRCLPEELAVEFRQRQIERAESTGHATGSTASQSVTSDILTAERIKAVEDVMKFFRSHIESREDCRLAHRKPLARESSDSFSDAPPTALSLTARSTPTSSPPRSCPLCNSTAHGITECQATLPPSEKRRLLAANRCCFKCGKRNHLARECRSSRSLTCMTCRGHHLSLLHDIQPSRPDRSPAAVNAVHTPDPGSQIQIPNREHRDSSSASNSPVTTAACLRRTQFVLLQTARAFAIGNTGTSLVRVLFDTGSHRSYIRQDVATQLQCPVLGTESITVYTFGRSKTPTTYHCRRVALTLRSQYHPETITFEALEVPEVCAVTNHSLDATLLNEMHDLGLDIADASSPADPVDAVISILIGSDVYWTMVTGSIRRLRPDLTAVETCLGWVIHGSYPHSTPAPSTVVTALSLACGPIEPCDLDPAEMWKLDTLGITDLADGKTQSHPAQQQFEDYVTFQGDRYQVPLLIKPSCCGVLADNRSIAQTRLLSQLRRLRDHPDLLKQYHDTISEYFLEGHAEKAPEVPQENLYYLPHHAVIRKEAVTTKVRVVFDASSHVSGAPSLNQVLQKGPNINADLLLQLVSFRCYPIILTADIRKAYLQILIRPEDRDALRFLWPEDLPCPENPCPQIQEWRMTRVPFGAASSPFLLAATLRHHFDSVQHKYPAATERLRHAFYVDDLIVGATSEEDALQIYREAVTMLLEASVDPGPGEDVKD